MNGQWLKTLLKYGLGLGLLALVIYLNWEPKPEKVITRDDGTTVTTPATPGISEVMNRPFHPSMILLAAFLCAASLVLTIFRWHGLVVAQGLPFTRRSAMRLGLVGYFFNTFLPGSIGGDFLKAYQISRGQKQRAVAVATVIVDRVVGLWALVWFVALIGGIFITINDPVVRNPEVRHLVQLTFWVAGISTSLWIGLSFMPDRTAEKLLQKLARLPKVGKPLAEMGQAAWLYHKQPRAILEATFISLVSHSGWVVAFYFAAQAFDIPNPQADLPSFSQHLILVPVGMTLQALFPAPGGVGGGEAAFAWLYTVAGKPAANGILACLAQRIVSWGLGLLGYLVYSRIRQDLTNPAEEGLLAERTNAVQPLPISDTPGAMRPGTGMNFEPTAGNLP